MKSRYLLSRILAQSELTESRFSLVAGEAREASFQNRRFRPHRSRRLPVYLGRKDFQVKIRGHRVELAEIERALLSVGQFKDVVVVSLGDHPGEERLVAYLVAGSETAVRVSSLRAALAEKLPDYMIPESFLMLDAMPLTATGKVDRVALPRTDRTRGSLNTVFVAPRTRLEKEIANVWAEVLTLDVDRDP